jgi:zinc D-Ala-D-Ala carboxypeptidase
MNTNTERHPLKTSLVLVGFLCLIGSTGYLSYRYYEHTNYITMLLNERNYFLLENASSSRQLTDALAAASSSRAEVASLTEKLMATEQALKVEERRNEAFADQIDDIAGTVGVLDKLSKTDEELLQKYSKVYFLNENYTPSRLKLIDSDYVMPGKGEQYFHAEALPFLIEMLDDAKADGIDLSVVSAYRSFETQQELKGAYTQTYGSGANAFSADQGYSEHQLGTTLDITDPSTAGTYTSFKDTEAYAWLLDNAYRYGFILSYPEGNAYYIFEPWHWRFVGTDLARDLHRADANFYDWDQRTIDEYLVSIFD